MSILFSPFPLRGILLKNRVMMSPMAQYMATKDGYPTDWHLVHYGARAIGGVGLIMLEVTAVEARGRLTERDLGLWDDSQIKPLSRLVHFLQGQGARVGIQIGHAGRKAWNEEEGHGPTPLLAPSPLPFAEGWPTPREMNSEEIAEVRQAFLLAAKRALEAGFDVLEIHAAHGYLLHQFLSPLINRRKDEYGGTPENRARLLLEIIQSAHSVWPQEKPLFVRLSCTDWVEGGLTAEDTVLIAKTLKNTGVDLVDCSSGGAVLWSIPKAFPGYQVPFARAIREKAGLATAAVGLITEAVQAENILEQGSADLIAVGRALLRNPHWPLYAAYELQDDLPWPEPYKRAKFQPKEMEK